MESILVNFPPSATAARINKYTKWNTNNISGAILNMDGNCHKTPTRTGFGGVLRNDPGLFIVGFSSFIPDSCDILLAELSAISHSITMANNLGYAEFACYFDSLVCINLINGPIERYHIYALLIQDIKHLLHQINVHTSWKSLELLLMLIFFFMSRLLLVLLIFSEVMPMALCSSGVVSFFLFCFVVSSFYHCNKKKSQVSEIKYFFFEGSVGNKLLNVYLITLRKYINNTPFFF